MNRNVLPWITVTSVAVLFAANTIVYGQMGGTGGGGGMMGGGGFFGGGGIGGGGMKTQLELLTEEITKNPVTWTQPTGEKPSWLKNGKSSVDAAESLRAMLNESIDVEETRGLEGTRDFLKVKCGVDIEINLPALQAQQIEPSGLDLAAGSGHLREHLRRMLEPKELAYRVRETCIEITTREDAYENPSTRYYDLSYIVRDNSRFAEILGAIYTSVDPDSWSPNGGKGTCVPVGPLLIVRTSEANHLEIERLLARISLNQPAAATTAPSATFPTSTEAKPLPGMF